jgi:hypothetical protein
VTTACSCGRALPDGVSLCPTCVTTLEHAIVNVVAHHGDLETLRTKRTRYGSSGASKGSIGKSQPIGVDLRFVTQSNATDDDLEHDQIPGREGQGTAVDRTTTATLLLWTAWILKLEPPLAGPICAAPCLHRSCAVLHRRRRPDTTVPSMAAYLLRQRRLITSATWGPQLLRDLLRVERSLAALVDRPPDRWYAGKCSAPLPTEPDDEPKICQRELYAKVDSGKIVCTACRAEHDITERREILLREAKEYHVTATQAAGALIAWTDYDGSETKLVDLIRKWRDRDKLEIADVTSLQGKDRHLYRLGDVQDLLVQHAQREQLRRIRDAG